MVQRTWSRVEGMAEMKDTWKILLFIAIIVLLVLSIDVGGILNAILGFILGIFGSILRFTESTIIVLAIIVAVIVLRKKR